MLIAETDYDVVFDRTVEADGLRFVAPSQAVVDLLTAPGRGPAEGQPYWTGWTPMKPTGNAERLVAARRALLDALDTLAAHRQSVIVIGAQAIYMHTGAAAVGLAGLMGVDIGR